MLGLTLETISRLVSRFQRDGLISVHPNRVGGDVTRSRTAGSRLRAMDEHRNRRVREDSARFAPEQQARKAAAAV